MFEEMNVQAYPTSRHLNSGETAVEGLIETPETVALPANAPDTRGQNHWCYPDSLKRSAIGERER